MEDYRKALTVWYNHTKRELPWRESRDPYSIWVSEVILQQTRVLQGIDYYWNFLRAFPDIKTLALASEQEVLKVWQGLGYYSRARNMHHAAKTILSDHLGLYPTDYPSIRKLKGIGDYTAAAIASIAFNLPYAAVDGNVYRVLSRLFGIATPIDSTDGKKEFANLALELLDKSSPGEFNQAMMEFGAIQCLPAQPLCSSCPLAMRCHAFVHRTVSSLPVKTKKTIQKERYFNYLFLHHENQFMLEKRGDKDIWRNMYQFPLIETNLPATIGELLTDSKWLKLMGQLNYTLHSVYPEKIHLLTHQRLHIRFISIALENNQVPEPWLSVEWSESERYAVPKPIELFLQEHGQ